jgi:hypothetical protein
MIFLKCFYFESSNNLTILHGFIICHDFVQIILTMLLGFMVSHDFV